MVMLRVFLMVLATLGCIAGFSTGAGADLAEIKAAGVLRHLGVPYSNFVSGDGDGLDVEILKLYASSIGVRYEHVPTTWGDVISDLSGKKFDLKGDKVEITGDSPVRGDIVGNGLTVLPWRQELINFSTPYFPSAVWVVASAKSDLRPIQPSADPAMDVMETKKLLVGRQILGIRDTCLDPASYDLPESFPAYKDGLLLNDLPAAVIKGEYEITLQDAPDAMFALIKNPGKIKVLGPITDRQVMAFGIPKNSPELQESFDAFLKQLDHSGKKRELIIKYYPKLYDHFPEW